MKLSIITINKNNAKGLRKTMESVFSQTYRDFEYIVVDGASSDDSVRIIKEFAQKFETGGWNLENFKWISEPDTGVYNAMNKGIKKATGEYLLFLNSGDFFVSSDVLEKVFSVCNGADILCAQCNVSKEGKKKCTIALPQSITFGRIYYHGLPHQSTFIKRSLFDTYGLYREDFKYNSDVAFWCKVIIDNHVSTQTLDIVTTDYNLEGISAKEHQSEQYLREIQQIFAPYNKFTPDYDAMKGSEDDKMWDWVKCHKYLVLPLEWMYKFAYKVNKR